MKKNLEIYIHIPFCRQKCAYCDFLSFPDYNEKYIDSIKREIAGKAEAFNLKDEYIISTIFIGGGTPSFIEADDIVSIIDTLYKNIEVDINAEITIETNPGTLNKSKLKAYKGIGINRLSIGLQSVNNAELKRLGRIHTYEEFLNNYYLARETGFENINIDLMSALPNQTIESFNNTLKTIITLNPEHISAYSLIIEEGTKFYELYSGHRELLPSEEAEREMYYNTKALLAAGGYERYEVSNYAKPGFECRHNIGYWRRNEYIGFGIGAASLINSTRFTNIRDIHKYIQFLDNNKSDTTGYQALYYFQNADFGQAQETGSISIYCEQNKLSVNEQMEEFMFLGLRMMVGISINEFENSFNCLFEEVYGKVLNKLINEELVIKNDDRIFLSERGIDVSNYVLSEFLI